MNISQVWCGASRTGEAGEGDRAGGESADDAGAASSCQNFQRVLPARRPLPARGEFGQTGNEWHTRYETFYLEAISVVQE